MIFYHWNENKIKYHGIYQIRMCETSECFIHLKFDRIVLWTEWEREIERELNKEKRTLEEKQKEKSMCCTFSLHFYCYFRFAFFVRLTYQYSFRIVYEIFNLTLEHCVRCTQVQILCSYIYLIYITRLSVFQLTKNLFLLLLLFHLFILVKWSTIHSLTNNNNNRQNWKKKKEKVLVWSSFMQKIQFHLENK